MVETADQAGTGPDQALRKAVFTAMMDMQKIDVAKIEAARRG
jgi:predicted 3-demethylubiquinone-9 3-methyltransferase (glyoxalase superfamily)